MDWSVRGGQRIGQAASAMKGEKIQLRCIYLAGVRSRDNNIGSALSIFM